jgi:hypothetical protein
MALSDKRREAVEALRKRRLQLLHEANREMLEARQIDDEPPVLPLTSQDRDFLRVLHIKVEP